MYIYMLRCGLTLDVPAVHFFCGHSCAASESDRLWSRYKLANRPYTTTYNWRYLMIFIIYIYIERETIIIDVITFYIYMIYTWYIYMHIMCMKLANRIWFATPNNGCVIQGIGGFSGNQWVMWVRSDGPHVVTSGGWTYTIDFYRNGWYFFVVWSYYWFLW